MTEFNTIFIEKSKLVDCSKLGDEKLIDFVSNHGVHIEQFNPLVTSDSKRIIVLGGGMSAEREVSYMSSNGIVRSLLSLGYLVTFMDMGADISMVLAKLKPIAVFNALHGTYGEDGCVPGLLNIMRIPYTGCGVLASSLAFNKKKSNEIFRAGGINIPKSQIVKKSDNLKISPFKPPYVIKPLSQGSSVGVEIIFPADKFDFALYKFPYGDEVIVEEYISGREMQIAVLGGKALGVLEIKLLKGKRFYDYETKYTEGFAEHLLPAPVTKEVYEQLMRISEKAYTLFDCKGMVRVEIIYDERNNAYYTLEVNTHPGMTPLSICPEIAAAKGISYTELVEIILKEATFEQ
jgi:D-alanine-D-alanine ligase